MLNRQKAKVIKIVSERPGAQEILVSVEGKEVRAVNYPDLTGPVFPGEEVLINTTAVDLELGTGGMHFVICNLSNPVQQTEPTPGHIMKLRYTPLQEAVLSVEEEASPDHAKIGEFKSLGGMPVVCCELHSQIAGVAAALKVANHRMRIAYIMTDGAALPIGFSRLASELKTKNLLDTTITCGQAFGGDIEAVNLYTALIAAKEVVKADAAIVCQGPGNAGTNVKFGFSGIEQGEAVNAARILGGMPVVVVRISFADKRERHYGVSHHTQTILNDVVLTPAYVALPVLSGEKARIVEKQMKALSPRASHNIRVVDGEPGLAELSRKRIKVTTMGRSIADDREFFLAASAGGVLAAELLRK